MTTGGCTYCGQGGQASFAAGPDHMMHCPRYRKASRAVRTITSPAYRAAQAAKRAQRGRA